MASTSQTETTETPTWLRLQSQTPSLCGSQANTGFCIFPAISSFPVSLVLWVSDCAYKAQSLRVRDLISACLTSPKKLRD